MMIRPLPLLSLFFLAAPTWAQDNADSGCANLSTALNAINAALDEALLDEAEALAEEAQEALLCQPNPVSPMVINAIFSLKGAVHIFQGREKAAEKAFEWAVSVSPLTPLDAMLGARPVEAYNRVRDDVMARPAGTLQLDGDAEAWIDGRPIAIGAPVELPAGPHLLQWRHTGESAQGRVISLAAGEVRTLPVGKVVPATTETGTTASTSDVSTAVPLPDAASLAQRRMVYLAGGGGLVAAGGSLLAAGFKQRSHVLSGEFKSEEELDTLQTKANTLGAMGIGSATIGAGLLGVGLLTTTTSSTLTLGGQF